MRITVELDTRSPLPDGRVMVKLVLFHRTRSRYSTGIHVDPSPKAWDKAAKRVRYGAKASPSINAAIQREIDRAQGIAMAHPGMRPTQLREALKRPVVDGVTVVELARRYLSDNSHRFGAGVMRTRETAIRNLEAVAPYATPKDITADHIAGVERELTKAGLHHNTIRSRVRILRTLYRASCKMADVPVRDIFAGLIRKEQQTAIMHLTADEVQRVKDVTLPRQVLRVARDAWLFAMYCGGVRFGDLCRLKPSNVVDGALVYTQHKAHRPKWVPLSPLALEVIERYRGGERLLPLSKDDTFKAIASANVTANRWLKDVAKLAGVRPMATHMARHTFTAMAVSKGADLRGVQLILGHSSLAQTETYMAKFDEEAIRKVMRLAE